MGNADGKKDDDDDVETTCIVCILLLLLLLDTMNFSTIFQMNHMVRIECIYAYADSLSNKSGCKPVERERKSRKDCERHWRPY